MALLRAFIVGICGQVALGYCSNGLLLAACGAAPSGGRTAGQWGAGRYGAEERCSDAGSSRQFMTASMPGVGSVNDNVDSAEQLRREKKQWAKKNALLTDVFMDLSHEFRTPLSIIQLAAELLDEHVSRGELERDRLRNSIDAINVNTRRLTRLVGNMLDIIRINAGARQPAFSPVNISVLLRKVVELVKPYAERRGLKITLECRRSARILCTDAEMAARIVVNLLSNAIKYTPHGGRIRVACTGGASGCRIPVEDTGIGMPEDVQREIFNCFYRADNTLTRTSEGCGIGLSLTKSLAELLGGSVWVKSTPGRGSAFFVDLPDRREASLQPDAVLLSGWLQDLVLTELSDISM